MRETRTTAWTWPVSALRLRVCGVVLLSSILVALPHAVRSQQGQKDDAGSGGRLAAAEQDPASDLTVRRDSTRTELEQLAKSISVSRERAVELQRDIADLEKTSASLRSAIVQSATKRTDLEMKILAGEKKLDELRGKESALHKSLIARRGVLANVLAALQRMGRNPPPALLVTPEDALSSVRSAILLGAVVPEIRHETEALTADLQALAGIRKEILGEKETLVATMISSAEEEKRIELLLAEKDKLKRQSSQQLAAEKIKAEELAGKATSLSGLIASLETEITSVRDAAKDAKALEDERSRLTQQELEQARELARTLVPDKNRIAPAYEFSQLQKKLPFPVTGSIFRQFGEEDGTGHPLQGMVLATSADALVTAPADGWVVFSGKFRSYGEMIILNPGNGYHIVIAGMDRTNVRQGQFVVAGEPLAVMGAKRVASATALALETDKPTLYIEFRKDGKPVDSRPWWTSIDIGRARNDT